ncbi:MAG: hypothetical protein IKO26_06710 [Paludibacteraceae bacterium]|nr:hypothetical protein [Paludibacteraceae bacterium]
MDRNDIEITDIDIRDSFRYAGRVFHGLEDLKRTAFDRYSKERRMKESPYVVIVDKHYPCFDSEDYANESRYYQNYYLTTSRAKAEQICEDYDKAEEYPVMEPMFSMSRIEEKHLPYIYYHGEGDTLQIVQNKHAEGKDRITIETRRYDFSFPNPFRGPDTIGCLYGPPPDYEDSKIINSFDEEEGRD